MKKKIILKTLAVLVILVGIGLLTLSVIGILDGNKTYDLFKKINVGTGTVYEEIDQRGLEAVKEDYRSVYKAVDQVDALGPDYAMDYLDDTGIVYGLVDTIEVTGKIVELIKHLGFEEARNILNETENAIDEAQKSFDEIKKSGAAEASSYLVDLESELSRHETLEETRAALDEKYAEANEETAKQIKSFLDFAFTMAEYKGSDETVQYLKEAAEATNLTVLEFAKQKIDGRISAQGGEAPTEILQYVDDIFRLTVDQDSVEGAQKYIAGLIDIIEKTGEPDIKAYLEQVYPDSDLKNLYTRKNLDNIYQAITSQGFEYVKENGYEICSATNQDNADQNRLFLERLHNTIEANPPDESDAAEWVKQYVLAVESANDEIDGRANRYLTGLYDAYEEARKSMGLKPEQRVEEATRKLKESVATKAQRKLKEGLEKAAACPDQEKLDKAKDFQRDVWLLSNQIGLEKTKKYLEYACGEAFTERSLQITELGNQNTRLLDELTTDEISRIREKSSLMILGIICLIIGIVLMVFRPSENNQPRLSREQKKAAGQHMGLKTSRMIANTLIHALLILISVIWLIPFIAITMQSLRVESTWQVGYVMPEKVGFLNYVDLLDTSFPKWYLNTFIMALCVAVLQTLFVLCMSYTLSRFRFKMRKVFMRFMLILGMFPGMLSMIILYNVLKDLGMIMANAVPGLILVYVASSGMGYYVSKGFFDTIPKSLDEAARIDGATRAQVLYKIILPLSKPIVIYTVLTAFMGPWGDYVFAKYVSNNEPLGMNAAVGLNTWLSADQIAKQYTMFCAGGVLVAVPVTILFMCLQRYYVEGVTGGAVKG